MPKRIDKLTDAQRAQLDGHADKWIEIGLRTGAADRPRFERAARECYEAAKLPWHGRVIWVSSPIVMAIAAPIAALLIKMRGSGGIARLEKGDAVRDAVGGAVRGAVGDAVGGAVGGAVRGAVGGAVRDAVGGAVGGAVRGAVGDAVRDAVRGAVGDAVGGAVGGAVGDAVRDAVRDAVGGAVRDAVGDAVGGAVGGASANAIRQAVFAAISRMWGSYLGGQFWAGGWYWGGAYTSFFREVCELQLTPEMWRRGIAYEETIQSACWWWPHRDFLMVCERPTEIHRELVNQNRPRGWGSHRLHNESGAAVKWPDGWGVYAVHGVRLPAWVIEHPERVTVDHIERESNAEIRRVMITRYGIARYMQDSKAELVHELPENYFLKGLQGARLFRKARPGDSDIVVCQVRNSTPEPDGSIKPYFLRIDPRSYNGEAAKHCHAAIASTFRMPDDHKQMAYADWRKYVPGFES